MKLNKAQQEFVDTLNQPVICIAGAGSGKSSTMIQKVKHLTNDLGINPSDILLLSFSRNSANDLQKKLKKQKITGVTANTFHSVCKRICEANGYDMSKQLKLFEIENMFTRVDNEADTNDILRWISYQKSREIMCDSNDFIFSENDLLNYTKEVLIDYYKMYENLKTQKGCYDFDDMLLIAKKILSNLPKGNEYQYKYIMVDEAQDTSKVQFDLAKLLCSTNNIQIIGDFRQSIYKFRGAYVEKFLNFPKENESTKVIQMNTNYRSDTEIVRISNNFIRNYYEGNELLCDSVAFSQNEGRVEKYKFNNTDREAEFVVKKIKELIATGLYTEDDFYILYRNNKQAFEVELELKDNDIPYTIKDNGGLFKMREIQTIVSILRLVENENDNMAFKTILKNRISDFKYLNNYLLNDIIKDSSETGENYLRTSMNLRNLKPFQEKVFSELYYLVEDLKEKCGTINTNEMINEIVNSLKIIKDIENTAKNDEEIESRKSSIFTLKKFANNKSVQELIDFVYSGVVKGKKKKGGVSLLTVHSSKGLENECVFVIGVNDGVFPSGMCEDILEEARLMYVALTRSKKQLYITSTEPSRFFKELDCEEKKGRILG